MYSRETLKRYQTQFESRRRFVYDDATGKPPLTKGRLTIGIGWNLTAHGLPEDIIDALYARSVDAVEQELRQRYPWFVRLDDVRQLVLMDMGFNMGVSGLAQFRTTLAAVEARAWPKAAAGMRASRWYRQVGSRAKILTVMMESGQEMVDV